MLNRNYSKFQYYPINEETGVSELFDIDHYSGYIGKTFRNTMPQGNYIVKRHEKEYLSLLAFGVNAAKTYSIMKASFEDFENITKSAFTDHTAKMCVYYSYRIDALKKLIGNYEAMAQQLIDVFTRGFKAVSSSALVPTEAEIRVAINKILNYGYTAIPKVEIPKELAEKEAKLRAQMLECNDAEMLSEIFTELLNVLNDKKEYNKEKKNIKQYKAIEDLTSCGIIKACQSWLRLHPDF